MGPVESVLVGVQGVLLIGIFFNTYLYGVVSFQYFSYFGGKNKDTGRIKAAVTLLFANDTIQSALMIYLGWVYGVRHFADPTFLDELIWPYAYIPLGTAITAAATHLPLASRIYILSKNKLIFIFLLLASLASFSTGLAFSIIAWTFKDLHRSDELLRTMSACWLSVQGALDLILAALSALFLHNHRPSADERTNNVINRLIRGAIQAGLIPVFFGVAAIVAFFAQPHTDMFVMFVIPLGRTYTIAFIHGLNVREELKQRLLGNDEPVDPIVTDVVFNHPLPTPTFSINQIRSSLIPAQPSKHRQAGSKGSKGSLRQITSPIIVHSPKAYQNIWDEEALQRPS